ncbi:MAG: transglutaminase-like domain-containing protein, partial [Limisphaerales bacterium]
PFSERSMAMVDLSERACPPKSRSQVCSKNIGMIRRSQPPGHPYEVRWPWLRIREARNCYNWIAEHIQYSYAIEYSTIPNISEYCLRKGYGDCGQESLLFITLCRLNGIPARWQSGWNTFPGEKTIHDWSEIYLAPYGWVPVDPYMGLYAMRYATSLSPRRRIELRDFYFGGLDQYRMAANSNHNQALTPPKQSVRSDDVDFQRGELEWDGHNIYFDQYTYSLSLEEMKAPARNE